MTDSTRIYFDAQQISLGSHELQGDYYASEMLLLPKALNERDIIKPFNAPHWSKGKHFSELKRIEAAFIDAKFKLHRASIHNPEEREAIATFIVETLELLGEQMGSKVTLDYLNPHFNIHSWISSYGYRTTPKALASELSDLPIFQEQEA